MMMICRLFLISLVALLLTVATASAQQPSPITITARVGLDGERSIRTGNWFPVQVTLTNEGPDRQIELEWRDQTATHLVQRYQIDLPGGARKQIIFPVIQMGRTALLMATSNGVEIWRERIVLNQLNDDDLTIGLLSADPSVLSSLATATFANDRRAALLILTPDLLADNPLLLTAFDVIIIRELTAELRPAQRDALLTWVQHGGTLLIGGGATGETALRAFAEVLPVKVGPLRREASLSELERLAGLDGLSNSVPTLTVHSVTLRPNAQPVTRDGLISQINTGAGKIIFAAFDLAALRAWSGESRLWVTVLAPQPSIAPGTIIRSGFNNILQGSLMRGFFDIPSPMVLLGLIGTYIIIIGPLQFFALRRLRRLEWAWLTTPLLVVIFLFSAYGMSFVLRGSQAQVAQLTIVQSTPDSNQTITTTVAGIFAPQRRNYHLSFADTAFISSPSSQNRMIVERDGNTVTVPDLTLDAADFYTLIVEEVTTNSLPVTYQIKQTNTHWQGRLSNTSSVRLNDAMIVAGNDAQWLGTIEPGADVVIDLAATADNFTNLIWNSTSGRILNRAYVLENLFWYGTLNFRFNPRVENATLPGNTLYLIGWSDQVAPVTQINGEPTRPVGETLYIIALPQRSN